MATCTDCVNANTLPIESSPQYVISLSSGGILSRSTPASGGTGSVSSVSISSVGGNSITVNVDGVTSNAIDLVSLLEDDNWNFSGNLDFSSATVTGISSAGVSTVSLGTIAGNSLTVTVDGVTSNALDLVTVLEDENYTWTGTHDFTGASVTGIGSSATTVSLSIVGGNTIAATVNGVTSNAVAVPTDVKTFSTTLNYDSGDNINSTAQTIAIPHGMAIAPKLINGTAIVSKGTGIIGQPNYEGFVSSGVWSNSNGDESVYFSDDGAGNLEAKGSGQFLSFNYNSGTSLVFVDVLSVDATNINIRLRTNNAATFAGELRISMSAVG